MISTVEPSSEHGYPILNNP